MQCLEQDDQVLVGGHQQGGLSARCSSWSVVVHLRHVWINTLGGSVEAQSIQVVCYTTDMNTHYLSRAFVYHIIKENKLCMHFLCSCAVQSHCYPSIT